MKPLLINDKLHVRFPDGFQEMSREERAALKDHSGNHGISLKSTEHHIILSIGWTRVDGIRGVFSKMLRGKDPVQNAEDCYKKQMRSFGYRTQERLTREIAGVLAEGLRFCYSAQGIEMTGETYVFEKDRTLYYFHCYYRTQLSEESLPVLSSILDSVG